MIKTKINDRCIMYACASPEGDRARREKINKEHRKIVPDDLLFDTYYFTVSWEKNTDD